MRHRLAGLLVVGTALLSGSVPAWSEGPRIPGFDYGGTQRGAYGSGGANQYAGPPVDVPWVPATSSAAPAFARVPSPVTVDGRVNFSLPEASLVEITLHDVGGRVVMRPARGLRVDRGPGSLEFSVGALATGVYFYRFVAHSQRGRLIAIGKFVVVR